jgi:Sugar (and other) transporter
MYYISLGSSYVDGPAAFRIPWALQMIPAIGLFLGLIILPESPRVCDRLRRTSHQ